MAPRWPRHSSRPPAETEPLARSVPNTGGVYFVPAFSGLFAAHWDMRARGTIVGLTRFATRAHLVGATLEAIAFQSREVFEAMASDSGRPPESLKVDGGATENNLLMQLQADILGIPVVRPAVRETTALGSARGRPRLRRPCLPDRALTPLVRRPNLRARGERRPP